MTGSGKMSLQEAYEQMQEAKKLCSLGTLISSLDEDDRALLTLWLDDDDMTHYQVSRLLNSAGYRVHRNTVSDHRKKVCGCNR